MYKQFLILAAVGLGGCASVNPTIKATPADLGALEGQPLTVVGYPAPSFTAMTAGKVAAGSLFGALGGAIAGSSMNSAGDQIVAQNGVMDPAGSIAARLERDYAMRVRAPGINRVVNPGDDSVKAVSQLAGGKGLVFDLRTQAWMFTYFPTSWGRYRVSYVARARLIDAASGKLIGQVPCQYMSDQDENRAPTYDELLASQAALLKSRLESAAVNCADVIARGVFDNTVVAGTPAPRSAPPAPAPAPAVAPVALAATPALAAVPPAPPAQRAAAPVPAASVPVPPAQAPLPATSPKVAGAHVAAQPVPLLRQPLVGAPVERVIPAGATAQLKQRMANANGGWWFVAFEGTSGWVSESALQ